MQPVNLPDLSRIPSCATNAESWILLQLFLRRNVRLTANACRVTERRIQQVMKIHKIEVVKL